MMLYDSAYRGMAVWTSLGPSRKAQAGCLSTIVVSRVHEPGRSGAAPIVPDKRISAASAHAGLKEHHDVSKAVPRLRPEGPRG
jgi:hypothetical protein